MKRIRYIGFLFLLVSVYSQKTDTEKILFIGNSFTFYFNLPLVVESMAEVKGVDLDVYYTSSNINNAKNKIDNISDKYILNIDLDYFVCFGEPTYGIDGDDTISHNRTVLDLGYAMKDHR